VGFEAAIAQPVAEPDPVPVTTPTSAEEKKKGPTVAAYGKGKLEKFGTQTNKGKIIMCYRNADKHHQGVRITIHPTKFKTYDQVCCVYYLSPVVLSV
jgi:hypothetical protein